MVQSAKLNTDETILMASTEYVGQTAIQPRAGGRGGPGFFLGGDALVSCSTSTPINHIVFFLQNTSCIRKP